MEIRRNPKIEYGGGTEASASVGSRSASSMPRYTKKEIEAGLGPDVSRQLRNLFAQLIPLKNDSH